MEVFAQNKLLIRLVIVLTILNLCAIGVFIWKDFSYAGLGPHKERKNEDYHDVAGVLQRELGLTELQVEQFKKLRTDVFAKESDLSVVIRAERDSMNVLMFSKNTDSTVVKNLAREVAENEFAMEMLRYQQAHALKSICSPEQMNKFDKLVIEIRDYFRPDNLPGKN